MTTDIPSAPIPQPTAKPIVGNLFDLDSKTPVQSMLRLAQQYGPIFKMELPGRTITVVSGHELVNELSDEKRFDKLVSAPLRNVRAFAGDGLFTAWTNEPNWHKAHNILLPNFSMKAMQGYMPMMIDIAEQLMLKWQRLNPDDTVDVADDMTRLTLDTIGLCGFNYRFNSFYRADMHPFVQAMVASLGEAMGQLRRMPLQDKLMVRSHHKFQDNIDFMNKIVDNIIAERKASGDTSTKDLLSYMLAGVDKKSGQGLDDINIRYQIITFLIAGHETTSGLLSFAIYYMLKHPEVLRKAYEEVDGVLGTDASVAPSYAQVQRLTYIGQILKESLRLWPTAPAFGLYPYEDTVIGGQYQLHKGDQITVLIPGLHRDRAVWGDDVEEFRPERFAPERERELPPNAFKPFGNGQRACIGRQFALQEATLLLGMILQRFELIDHSNYQLHIKETLTLKPDAFRIKVRARKSEQIAAKAVHEGNQQIAAPSPLAAETTSLDTSHGTPLLVLYGSNLGTAEGIAQEVAGDAEGRGYRVTLASLDEYVDKLPTSGGVVIVSASYNGLPPDNAVAFVDWLRSGKLAPDALRGVSYSLFGCGDHNWATTYQAVPTLIDQQLAAHGAERIYVRGEGDAADDFDGQFRAWYAQLWPTLAQRFGLSEDAGQREDRPTRPLYEVELVTAQRPHPFVAAYGAQPMTVVANRELQNASSGRSTRHIELALPADVSYRTGDHLGVLPRNSDELIGRVLERFKLDGKQQVIIHRTATGRSQLPLDQPTMLNELLAQYVELQETATRAQISVLAEYTECPPHKRELLAWAGDDEDSKTRYRAEIFMRHVSILDLLERYAACELPFNVYLEMLPPLKPRYYSISSSPLVERAQASLTVGVVADPARSGKGEYRGVASNYLACQREGATVYGFVRSPNAPFEPPADPRVPMIMVGPGTGLAPFRGFAQERLARKQRGEPIGPALLFFGCRAPEHDFIYQDELQALESEGVLTLVTAFSRIAGQPKCYVQHNIANQADAIWTLLERDAVVYICGDGGRMAPDVRAAFAAIYRTKTGGDDAQAERWLQQLERDGRYLTDVWASS